MTGSPRVIGRRAKSSEKAGRNLVDIETLRDAVGKAAVRVMLQKGKGFDTRTRRKFVDRYLKGATAAALERGYARLFGEAFSGDLTEQIAAHMKRWKSTKKQKRFSKEDDPALKGRLPKLGRPVRVHGRTVGPRTDKERRPELLLAASRRIGDAFTEAVRESVREHFAEGRSVHGIDAQGFIVEVKALGRGTH